MNEDDLTRQLRDADGPVTPDPRFADRLYAELATELAFPAARPRVVRPARGRATRRGMTLLAAALLLVSLGLVAALVGGRLLVRPVVVTASTDWAGFKGDAARRGEGVDGPRGDPVLRWRFQADGAVPDNVAVAGDLAYASSDDGVLHALDVMTGEEHWSYAADEPPLGGPVLDAGAVYAFGGDGVLHALDALTGEPRWRSADPVAGPSSPTVGDGAVYTGAADGTLVAIETATGTTRWRTPVAGSGGVNAPAYLDGKVYVASQGGGAVRVDAASGSIDWRFGEAATSTTVVADGLVYVGFGAPDGTTGTLWALDPATGTERWHVDRPIFTPAVADGVAYSGSDALGVTATDVATGRELWRFPIRGVARPLGVADGVVYVPADSEHRVYALDAATGTELWRFDVGAPTWCCVAIARGAVYAGTQLGGIYAITGSENEPAPKD